MAQFMAGTYTIKLGISDFDNDTIGSFTEAVDSLISRGVNGPVLFNAQAATYDENFVIPAITGANGTNTITFQSETGDSNDVRIQHSGFDTANYIVWFEGASYITLQNMTFSSTLSAESVAARIIYLNNEADDPNLGSNNITLRNNLFYGKDVWDYSLERGPIIQSSNENIYDILIDNNLFSKGESAISLSGSSGAGQLTGIQITNNTATNQRERSMHFSHLIAPVLSGNTITQNQHQDRGGISLTYVTQGLRIIGNTIDMIQPGENCIRLISCTGDESGAGRGLIANNMVRASLQDAAAQAVRLENSTNQRIYHNTVRVRGVEQPDSRALYVHGGSSANIDIQNNIFQNTSRGYTVYIASSGYVNEIGHNNYSHNSNLFARWGGTNYDNLETFVTQTAETGSLSVPPNFEADNILYSNSGWLDDEGADLSTVVDEDIDGVSRLVTQSIGANQYTVAESEMEGDYYIGGTSPDYATISEALDDLELRGVSASVFFNLRDDAPFVEKNYLATYAGTSSDNRITFQSDTNNSGNAIITYAGTYNGDQTIGMGAASYITFKNLTISASNSDNGVVFDFYGHCSNDSIIGCTINGAGKSGSDNVIECKDDILSDIHFVGNTINNGNMAIYLDGFDTRYIQNLSFVSNIFNEQYVNGICLIHASKPEIRDNYVMTSSGASTNYAGIYLGWVSDDFKILGNEIFNDNGNDNGIYINTCTASQTFPSLVANNFVTAGGGDIDVAGIRTNDVNWCNIYHNTVNIQESNGGQYAIESEAYANSGGGNINLLNNLFINYGSGRAITNTTPSAFILSDYNCLFAGKKILVRWNGDYPRLTEYQANNPTMDQNSISINPIFASTSDLHINSPFIDEMVNTGSTGITHDFDGDLRSGDPDAGADEFSATRLKIAAGTYSVGTSGDYTTVKEAFDSLQTRGIAGPVTFQLKSQDFSESIGRVLAIPGASTTDTIVIESESGNPEDVTIFNGDGGSLITFKGVDNMTFQNLTVSMTNSSGGRPIAIGGVVDNLKFINNHISSANTVSHNLLFYESIVDNVLVKDNTIEKGNGGIFFAGDENIYSKNIRIVGNTVNESLIGIRLLYQYAPEVINNVIYNKEKSSFEGIWMDYCIEDLVVSGNQVNSLNSQYGIYLYQCRATYPFSGLISNNSVHIGETSSSAYGLYLHYCERMNLYHNSSHITATGTNNGFGIYLRDANLHINVMNNVASNSGGGYAYVVNDGTDIDTSDYNNFYATGTNLARWGGTNCTDLTALMALSTKDANSISVDPLFYSNTDLHSKQAQLHQKAYPLSVVRYDADSVERDAANPDIGAYEFTCVTPTLKFWTSPTCQGDSTMIIDSSMNIAPGSTRAWDLNGDASADIYTENDFETIMWLFPDAGDNTVSYAVQQIAGCPAGTSFDVSVTPSPELSITTKGAYCDTTDGWAKVSVTNIPGPFQYFWSDGQTDSIATGLAIGSYTVAVTDETGCSSDSTIVIGEAIEVTVTQIKASTCGVPDGQAVVSAEGGFGPYDYVWSNGETSDTNKILSPGPHYVNAIDSKGCFAQGSINLESDGGPQIAVEDISYNECYGDKSGSIDISISKGVEPYSIIWSNGMTTEDIDNLAAGIYNVTVTDDDGCMGAGSFQVFQPSQISISPVVTDATCEGSDGSAVAVVSGGTKPYVYSWSSGGIYKIEKGLEAGVYTVTVTDAKGCQMVEPVLVNNVGAPKVYISDLQGVGCTVTNNGSISITVDPPSLLYTYNWSNGAMTKDISGLSAGTYEVTVSDGDCKSVNQAIVKQEPPDVNPICLVTVDTATGMNMVIWEKAVTEDVSYYNVYRESSVKGDFQLIGSVDFLEESLYVDSIADPTIRSWRYRLSVVDDCGNESDLSDYHKTMHLTMNVGLDESVNLLWDHYEGFEVGTYEIFRYDSAANWNFLTDISSNNTSYVDLTPPKQYLTYFIEVEHPAGGCTSDDKKASTFNSSKSNRKNRLKSGSTGIVDLMGLNNLRLYPNPGQGMYNLSVDLDNLDNVSIKVFDITGKIVMNGEFENVPYRLDTQIDLTAHPDGIYQVHLKTNKAYYHRILIKK